MGQVIRRVDWQRQQSSDSPAGYGELLTLPLLVVCVDADDVGEKAAIKVATLSRAVKIIRVPIGKVMNEF